MEPRKVELPAPLRLIINFVLTYFLHYTYRSLKNTIQYIINLRVYCTVYSVRLRTVNIYLLPGNVDHIPLAIVLPDLESDLEYHLILLEQVN